MSLDVSAVQEALRSDGLDAWLLYDFRGSNPLAQRLAGLDMSGHLATRRWFYLIPAHGTPQALVHKIESRTLAHLPGDTTRYAGRVELVRAQGVEVVTSADLIQTFEAVWSAAAMATHRQAAEVLYDVKDRAFETIARRLRDGEATTEYDIQSLMSQWLDEAGLVTGGDPIVAAQENAGDPHYQPSPGESRPITRDNVVLLDLWGKTRSPGAVFADISWMGFTGPAIPAPVAAAFTAARDARDAAVTLIESAAAAGRPVHGWEADRAARSVLEAAGFGGAILHRTGHSLGEEIHGNGAHLDDYETRDERRLMPGTGFTIEPGLYFDTFGVRTEINVAWGPRGPEVTGPRQMAVVPLV
jgi:Xaa-Pro dipeptidase